MTTRIKYEILYFLHSVRHFIIRLVKCATTELQNLSIFRICHSLVINNEGVIILIDNFIKNDRGKIVLNETPEYLPQISNDDSNAGLKEGEEGYFTEPLARIYIKQSRYSKA